MTSEARNAIALELHRPRPTGRTAYVLGNAGEIYGIEPTYTCPEGCKRSSWFFAGDECDTYKALAAGGRAYEASVAAEALERAAEELPAEHGDYGYPAALRRRAAEIREAAQHEARTDA